MAVVIWHNPRCSNSRDALALLQARGGTPEIVDYLRTPPSAAEIRAAAKLMGKSVRDLIRTKEVNYRALSLNDESLDDAALAIALNANPALIERPIVFAKGKATIGRPPEAILAIL